MQYIWPGQLPEFSLMCFFFRCRNWLLYSICTIHILLYILTSHNSWYHKLHTHSLLTYLFYCPSSGTNTQMVELPRPRLGSNRTQDARCMSWCKCWKFTMRSPEPREPRTMQIYHDLPTSSRVKHGHGWNSKQKERNFTKRAIIRKGCLDDRYSALHVQMYFWCYITPTLFCRVINTVVVPAVTGITLMTKLPLIGSFDICSIDLWVTLGITACTFNPQIPNRLFLKKIYSSLYICTHAHLSIYLSVWLSVHLSIYLSI
jgi:hypothetical protein